MNQLGRGAGPRWMIGFVLLVLALSGTPELHARSSHKLPCKKIRDAVLTGRTLDEVAAQFGTDTEHVIRCIQKPGKGKQKKPKKSKKAKPSKPKTSDRSAVRTSAPHR